MHDSELDSTGRLPQHKLEELSAYKEMMGSRRDYLSGRQEVVARKRKGRDANSKSTVILNDVGDPVTEWLQTHMQHSAMSQHTTTGTTGTGTGDDCTFIYDSAIEGFGEREQRREAA